MAVEVRVPSVGESILEVQIAQWLKHEGELVAKDDDLVEIESEKATVTVPAPVSGRLAKVLRPAGDIVKVGEVIGQLEEATAARPAEAPRPATPPAKPNSGDGTTRIMPAAQRLLATYDLRPEQVPATGPGGRLLKEDVERYVEEQGLKPDRDTPEASPAVEPAPSEPEPSPEETPPQEPSLAEIPTEAVPTPGREERVVPMSMIRRAIAQRLVDAQHTAALLTTFNEVEMSEVIALRKRYGDRFQERHGVKLGFMSFFVKAVVAGLQQFPQLNAEIRERNVVYRDYFDIGVAIGGGKGLVVPVLRNAEGLGFAEIEQKIADLAARARDNRLLPEELEGGTFSISNGGVYGSMLSTPIVNPPQSGILGLHAIQDRPVARQGQVVIRPMMYLALTYDHRVVDGREAVTFLRVVKELVEDPARLFLEV